MGATSGVCDFTYILARKHKHYLHLYGFIRISPIIDENILFSPLLGQ